MVPILKYGSNMCSHFYVAESVGTIQWLPTRDVKLSESGPHVARLNSYGCEYGWKIADYKEERSTG
jgi:hypothetical protein